MPIPRLSRQLPLPSSGDCRLTGHLGSPASQRRCAVPRSTCPIRPPQPPAWPVPAGAEQAAAITPTTTARECSPAQGRSPSFQCWPPVRPLMTMLRGNKPGPSPVRCRGDNQGWPACRGPVPETHHWRLTAAAPWLSHSRVLQERSIQLDRRAHKGAMIFLSHRITPNSPCSVFVTTDYFSRTHARNESGHH